ncbi:MAG: tetratricopeptide repeat protein [Enterobacterales bacterium]|nr:tetratricopeptide repeat protein [Enterobacterales bacterium]
MDSVTPSTDPIFHIDDKVRQGYRLGQALVVPIDGEIICQGVRQHLAPKAMEILLYLSENHNRVISIEELLDFGWGDKQAKRSSLTHVIRDIRQALNDHKSCPEYIQTLPKKGYRLIAEISYLDGNVFYPNAWSSDSSSDPTLLRTQVEEQIYLQTLANEQLSQSYWKRSFALLKSSHLFRVSVTFIISTWVLLQVFELLFPIFNIPEWGLKIVVLILVAGFPLALLFTWLKEIKHQKRMAEAIESHGGKSETRPLALGFIFIGVLSVGVSYLSSYLIDSIESEQDDSLVEINSNQMSVAINDRLVAVLPFRISDKAKLPEYFKNTIQSEIISALSQQNDFNLVSKRAINEISSKKGFSDYVNHLGARYLLDGEIAEAKKGFFLLLSLVDAKSSIQIWTSKIPLVSSRLLEFQKNINRQVFNALALVAQREPTSLYEVINTNDFTAYDHYIQGKSHLANAKIKQDLDVAKQHFLTALKFDPNFSLASAGLCQTQIDQYQMTVESTDFMAAKMTCSGILQDQHLKSEGYVSLGNLNRVSGKHEQAIDYYQKALAINPDNLNAISGTALSYRKLGNSDKAEILLYKTIRLEPGYWKNYMNLGDFFMSLGKYRDAIFQYNHITLLKPKDEQGFNRLGAAYYLDDQIERAGLAWQQSLKIKPSATNYSNLGTALFNQKKFKQAQEIYTKALDMRKSSPIIWANLGDAQKFSGESKKANISYRAAITYIQEQLLVNPFDQTLLGMRARYRSEIGECSSALTTSESLQKKNISDPYLYYDFSIVAINCGQKKQAKLLIRKAVELGYSKKLLARDIQFSSIMTGN